jgi:hypothetical protein
MDWRRRRCRGGSKQQVHKVCSPVLWSKYTLTVLLAGSTSVPSSSTRLCVLPRGQRSNRNTSVRTSHVCGCPVAPASLAQGKYVAM